MTSVATMGVNLANRTMLPFSSPTAAAAAIMTRKPATMMTALRPLFSKKEPITTTRPASGPTDRSMPPVRITHSCPNEMNAVAAISTVSEVRLKVDRKRELWPCVYTARTTMAMASTPEAA